MSAAACAIRHRNRRCRHCSGGSSTRASSTRSSSTELDASSSVTSSTPNDATDYNYRAHTRRELLEMAEQFGVDVSRRATKTELVDALTAWAEGQDA
jgi:hypothetical protein